MPAIAVLFAYSLTVSAAATITVNSTADAVADDGECTLREAIIAANTNTASGLSVGECTAGDVGADTINFGISGTADFTNSGQNGYTIQPASSLPQLTEAVTINGYSQTGASANTALAPNPLNGVLLIELDGSSAGSTGAITFESGSGGSIVRGLVINSFGGPGFSVRPGANAVQIKGNYIGVDPTGLIKQRNSGSGITTFGIADHDGGSDNGIIGGLLPADRNIISGNDTESNDPNLAIGCQGIAMIDGSNNWTIQGNYIGIGADGTTAIPNELGGITIDYVSGLTIGGTTEAATNVFSGNGDGGIQPDYSDNIVIKGNYIGTDYTGSNPVPNNTKGVSFAFGSVDSIVGGTEPGAGNIIAFNNDAGIFTNDTSNNIAFIGNSIHSNGAIGIDLDYDGQTQNDLYDVDTGSNDLLNYPEFLTVKNSGSDTDITYIVDLPAGDYRIEFYENGALDPSGNGEGEAYLDYQNITVRGDGEQKFTHKIVGNTGLNNVALTATERNVDTVSGFGATSEFGAEYSQVDKVGDMSLTKELTNPELVAPGATISYRFTISNVGPQTIELSRFANSTPGADSLLFDILPTDLTYLSVSDPDVECSSLGEGSATFFGAILQDHVDHEVVTCGFVGTDTFLTVGESFDFTMDVLVEEDTDMVFTNKAFVAPAESQDPDTSQFGAAFFSGQDIFTLLGDSVNSVATASYPVPVEPGPQQDSTDVTNNNLLANTGQDRLLILIVAAALMIVSGTAVTYIHRARSSTRV